MNQPWIYMCSPSWTPLPPPSPSHPYGSSQCTSPEHVSHASNLGWQSVSHLIIYMFQCCSLRSSHPLLLPLSPKICLLHCLAHRYYLSRFHMHVLVCKICLSFSDLLHSSLYNRLNLEGWSRRELGGGGFSREGTCVPMTVMLIHAKTVTIL